MSDDNKKIFANSKEELEYYKNSYKLNVEELSSCKSKIKVLENINNKLKERITQNFSKTENNDASKVIFTHNDFKKLWESIIQTELIDSFDFCIKEYKLISNLSQDIMLLVYEETKKIIDLKFLEILKCLNLSKTSKNKKDNLYEKILPFFRENFRNIFELDVEKINSIKDRLKSIIYQYNFLGEIKINTSLSSKNLNDVDNYINRNRNIVNNNTNQNSNNDFYKLLENKIKGKNFEEIIKSFFTVCLYMLLHEPILNFGIEKYSQRKFVYYFFNKKDFINLEGFWNDKSPCLIILPAPLIKNKYPFNGLRPAVYILPEININSEILNQCKINEKKKEEESKMNSSNNINDQKINKKKIINHSNSESNNNNEKEIKLKYININLNDNKNETNSKNKKQQSTIYGIDENIQNNTKTNLNANEYNKNKSHNNIKGCNFIKIPIPILKINAENNEYDSNISNPNFKLVNRSINNNNKLKNKNQKFRNKNILISNNSNIDNNSKISYQNLSYGYINNQNNNLKSKANFINKNSNEKNNFSTNEVKKNENVILITKKEKTLPGKLQRKSEFLVYDNNPFLNSSQKMQTPKEIINRNNKYQYLIHDIYENDEQNHNIGKNVENYQLNISMKPFEKAKKYSKNQLTVSTTNSNAIKKININNKGLREIKLEKGLDKQKICFNDANSKNYLNNKNNKNIMNLNNIYNYDLEKFKKTNMASTPSSEKVNIKYYSSLGNILNNQNNNLSNQISNNNNNSNLNSNNYNNNFNYTLDKSKKKEEYEYNFKDKKINYYSYVDFNNNSNTKTNNIEQSNKYTERRGVQNLNNENNDNINKLNLAKYYNIINNNSYSEVNKNQNKIEVTTQKKNYTGLNKNKKNAKENKAYYHSLKKKNLNPLFNAINDDNCMVTFKSNDIVFPKGKNLINSKINYINNINNYNNITNINLKIPKHGLVRPEPGPAFIGQGQASLAQLKNFVKKSKEIK